MARRADRNRALTPLVVLLTLAVLVLAAVIVWRGFAAGLAGEADGPSLSLPAPPATVPDAPNVPKPR